MSLIISTLRVGTFIINTTELENKLEMQENNNREENKPQSEFPLDKILKRLEVLKNVILLDDADDIEYNAKKLKQFDFQSDINEILGYLTNKEYSSAIAKIQSFITENNQLLVWEDPEIEALKLEIESLENQLNSLDNEKVELDKLISEFQNRHTNELGEIILGILKLRKVIFKDDEEKYKEAEQDQKEYQEQFEAEKEKVLHEITEDEKKELKKNYRKASMLCHPDKFINESPEIQNLANEIFRDLNEANGQNDLKRVNEILKNLENGILVRTKGAEIDDKKVLNTTIMQLRGKAQRLKEEIEYIKGSETYQTIVDIEDFDEYFSSLKEKLQSELTELQLKIESE